MRSEEVSTLLMKGLGVNVMDLDVDVDVYVFAILSGLVGSKMWIRLNILLGLGCWRRCL